MIQETALNLLRGIGISAVLFPIFYVMSLDFHPEKVEAQPESTSLFTACPSDAGAQYSQAFGYDDVWANPCRGLDY